MHSKYGEKKGITGHSTDKEQVAAAERKAATEPWNPEEHPDHSRKRGALGLLKARKGFEVRWVREDKVDQRKMQGYVLAKPEDYDCEADEKGMVRRNELVLMEVPIHVYEQRRSEAAKQSDLLSKSAKKEFLDERARASRESGHNLSDEDRDQE